MSTEMNSVYGVKRTTANYKDNNCSEVVQGAVLNLINDSKKKYNKILLLCIGTDRITGDALAPLLGTMLEKKVNGKFELMGTLENPVHAKNIVEKYESIDKENTLVIAIDACLGSEESIGNIDVTNGALRPGAGVGKDLPHVGDISIVGIVNTSGGIEFLTIQNTRLYVVMNIVNQIEKALNGVMNAINADNNTNNEYEQIRLFA